jgi:hypothetical protein
MTATPPLAPPALDYLASLEWVTAPENLCPVGPAGTGKSHVLVSLGVAAVRAGRKVRYFTAAALADALYRGLADNSVGKVIETLLRNDLILLDEVGFAPLDDTGAQRLFRFVSAARERRAPRYRQPLAIRPAGPVPARAHHRRQSPRPAPPPRQHRRHQRRLLPHAPSQSKRRNTPENQLTNPRGGDFHLTTSGEQIARGRSARDRPEQVRKLVSIHVAQTEMPHVVVRVLGNAGVHVQKDADGPADRLSVVRGVEQMEFPSPQWQGWIEGEIEKVR